MSISFLDFEILGCLETYMKLKIDGSGAFKLQFDQNWKKFLSGLKLTNYYNIYSKKYFWLQNIFTLRRIPESLR